MRSASTNQNGSSKAEAKLIEPDTRFLKETQKFLLQVFEADKHPLCVRQIICEQAVKRNRTSVAPGKLIRDGMNYVIIIFMVSFF